MKLDWINAGRAWPRARSMAVRFISDHAPNSPSQLPIRAMEQKWKKNWGNTLNAQTAPGLSQKNKAYILPMFPYPSGNLHLGHLRVYVISDVLSRFARLQGRNVIQPMGWDAFGLPAENAAIDRGVDPEEWTLKNIDRMREQLETMRGEWNWDREIKTCDSSYYKHTQRIFLLLYQHGLVYRAESLVNYDPIDKTVLANEQVDANGYSWRSGAKVISKKLEQWYIRITEYQEELLGDLKLLAQNNKWPERVLAQQENWLGKSDGAQIRFKIESNSLDLDSPFVETFTTRLDTLFGVQYLALSASHPIVETAAKHSPALRDFLANVDSFPEGTKEGFRLPEVYAVNPLASLDGVPADVREPLPVFVAPYVLSDYGSGAVMGVPAHDTRDFGFWKANSPSKSMRSVIVPKEGSDTISAEVFTQPGYLSKICGSYAGLSSAEATPRIIEALETAGQYAERKSTWRLRDWLISRQRYWGTPIPMIHCTECGIVPVPATDLPVMLPPLPPGSLTRTRSNPLEIADEWVNVRCPSCRRPARRETDTMDTFMDSSWYHLRFSDPENHSLPFSGPAIEHTLPVDLYIGGVEHAILHLLYARFMTKFLSSPAIGLVPPTSALAAAHGEPFTRLLTQGMVHGKTYTHPETGQPLNPASDLDESKTYIRNTALQPKITYEKMSKSKHNGIDPTGCIATHGADATRAHILFLAPVADVLNWDEERIVGVHRWLARIWRAVNSVRPTVAEADSDQALFGIPPRLSKKEVELLAATNAAVRDVTHALAETYALNTVVSSFMELSRPVATAAAAAAAATTSPDGEAGEVHPSVARYALGVLVRLMAPVTPVFSAECWERLQLDVGLPKSRRRRRVGIQAAGWPEELDLAGQKGQEGGTDVVECAVQINGKVKFVAMVEKPPSDAAESRAEVEQWFRERCWDSEEGRKYLGKLDGGLKTNWKRVVVVKGGKVVNFVQ